MVADPWVRLGPAARWQEGRGQAFEIRGREIAVFRVGERFFALDHRCPHRGGPLALGQIEDGILSCPWHGWRFELDGGRSAVNPTLAVECFPAETRDGEVWVRIGPPKGER